MFIGDGVGQDAKGEEMSEQIPKEPTRYEKFKRAALALCAADGADEIISSALLAAYHDHHESREGPWEMGPDDYYDLLEGRGIGHRRLKAWINEKRAGYTVTATRRGAALFAAIEGIQLG